MIDAGVMMETRTPHTTDAPMKESRRVNPPTEIGKERIESV